MADTPALDAPAIQVMPQGAPPSAAKPNFGLPTSRVEGRQKVTGAARYASDFPGQAHAYLVTSPIARGRITAIDESDTRSVPGVLDILTYRNVGDRVKPGKVFEQQGYMGTTIAPLASDRVQHDGQIVALVVADTFEAAREGAHRLRVTYAEEAPSASFDSPGATVQTMPRRRRPQSREGRRGRGGEAQGRRRPGRPGRRGGEGGRALRDAGAAPQHAGALRHHRGLGRQRG